MKSSQAGMAGKGSAVEPAHKADARTNSNLNASHLQRPVFQTPTKAVPARSGQAVLAAIGSGGPEPSAPESSQWPMRMAFLRPASAPSLYAHLVISRALCKRRHSGSGKAVAPAHWTLLAYASCLGLGELRFFLSGQGEGARMNMVD